MPTNRFSARWNRTVDFAPGTVPDLEGIDIGGPGIAGSTALSGGTADGVSWTEIGRRAIAMPAQALVGLAVTNHANATVSTATCTDVEVQP